MKQPIKREHILLILLIVALIAIAVLLTTLMKTKKNVDQVTSQPEVIKCEEDQGIQWSKPVADWTKFYPVQNVWPEYVLESRDFTFAGKAGQLLQVCSFPPLVVSESNGLKLCLGENSLVLDMDGERYVLDKFMIDKPDEIKRIAQIAFQFGTDAAKRESNRPDDRLAVFFTNDICIINADCHWRNGLSYLISVDDREVQKLSGQILPSIIRPDELMWNESGTKAFWTAGCGEGTCPDEYLYGYDLQTDTTTPLLMAADVGVDIENGYLTQINMEWLDDNTIQIEWFDDNNNRVWEKTVIFK
ncbi:hypothetical protein KJ611_02465 [Patescibacteria group bacterium]|nr:hypothetical protein [Patescibacteria group bacterium]MBU1705891.1 hypothetical protein [Patescibacteria group bacterium]